jgi:protein involved in polysaccharide export with SLBB domain
MTVFQRSLLSVLIVSATVVTSTSFAQLTQPGGQLPTLPTSIGGERSLPSFDAAAMITDGPVDPAEYKLGPGDMLQLRVWTSPDPSIMQVSIDQKLLVPRLGEFDARNKTLAQIAKEIEAEAALSFTKRPSSTKNITSVSLVQPRKLLVTVKGEVESPGVYSLTSATRAALAVELAKKAEQKQMNFADQSMLREVDRRNREKEKLRPYFGSTEEKKYSERYVIVTHSDGTSDRVDLVRYNATRDPKYCPLLREGDVIYVPFRREIEGSVALFGAIRAPGMYEFVEGDSLVGMIANAYGATPNADLTKVEVSRMSSNGESFVTNVYDVTNARPGSSMDVKLQSGDRIFVRERPDVRELSRVIVKGEVVRPGVYPITRTSTKLSDIIRQAGGVTDYAHLGGAYISRELTSREEGLTREEEQMRLWRLANLGVEDTANFRLQTMVRTGDVKVDMNRLLKDGEKSADVLLSDGDMIVIPTKPTTVYVWGYVGRMGYLPYVEGANLDHYIAAAGGYAPGAIKGDTRVIKSQTRQWMEPEDTQIQPGDEIYVPKEGDYSEDYSLRIIGSVSQIVGMLVSVASLIIALSRN